VPDDVPVYAGTQRQLLGDIDTWRDAGLGERSYYVSLLHHGGLRRLRGNILAYLGETHFVTLVGGYGLARIYMVEPRSAPRPR
jgi:hypothetical protein